MKPLLTRAFARNVSIATLFAAFGLVLADAAAGPAFARAAPPGPAVLPVPAAVPVPASLPAVPGGSPLAPGGPTIPVPWGPQAALEITIQASPSAPVWRWTLTCGPDGGTLPDPVRACRVLNRVWDPYTPVHVGWMCPMIVYGTQLTTISGYWDGTWISARFSRTFSCQAAQWFQILPVLPSSQGEINPGGPMLPGPAPRPGT